jgi:hypothetical protein
VAFFAKSLAVVSMILVACSSSDSGSSSGTNPGTDGGGLDGSSSGGDGGGGDADVPIDGGPKPYGQIPEPAPVNYTCSKDIHVATTGNDATGDGTSGNPYKTIVKGASVAAAGECVRVHQGTYAETATITFANDGAQNTPIVLVSADGKGKAVIDGAGNTAGPAIEVNKKYVVIDGFEIKNTPQTVGLHVVRFDGQNADGCEGSVLRNSKITGGFSQLKIYQRTKGVTVENNEFYGKSGNVPMSLTGASGLVFRANYCHDWDSGQDGSIQLAGGSTGARFEKNLFQDVATFAATLSLGDNCGSTCDNDPNHYAAVNAVARNNVFIRTVRAVELLGCNTCSVLSNTIIDAGLNYNNVFRLGSATTNGQSRTTAGARILNNLVTSPGSLMGHVIDVQAGAETGLQMDYNLYWNGPKGVTVGETRPAGADTHTVTANPLLSGPTDFHPGPGSPAIGAGTNLVTDVPDDFLGVARPASGPFDIGAIQH